MTADPGPGEAIHPYWADGVARRETLRFIREPGAATAQARLMYPIRDILSVRSAAWATNSAQTTFREGYDYIYAPGDGLVTLTASSAIPFTERSALYVTSGGLPYRTNPANPLDASVGLAPQQVQHSTYGLMSLTQVEVSYLHDGRWTGYVPDLESFELASTLSKLRGRTALRVLVDGDSISYGGGSTWDSGVGFTGIAPFQKGLADIFADGLRAAFDHPSILVQNLSVPGAFADDNLASLEPAVRAFLPDLLIIAYGMNDAYFGLGAGGNEVFGFRNAIEQRILGARRAKPDVDIILVSPMPGNPSWTRTLYPG